MRERLNGTVQEIASGSVGLEKPEALNELGTCMKKLARKTYHPDRQEGEAI